MNRSPDQPNCKHLIVSGDNGRELSGNKISAWHQELA